MTRVIDPEAAETAVLARYPNSKTDTKECVKHIAHHLVLKSQGLKHDDHTVAIYEEWCKT